MARFGLLGLAVAGSVQTALAGCKPHKPVLSCSAEAESGLVDSCKVETFGGLVLSTQFWDTYTGLESEGQLLPANSFTLHGLWPDFCNGSWTQYCDFARQYDPQPEPNTTTGKPDGVPVPPYTGPSVDTFLTALGHRGHKLLAWMNKFWIAQKQPNHQLWAHEFSKHATCFSTFAPSCFSHKDLKKHQDLFTFFDVSAQYFKSLPTYDWLAAADITPSNTTSYTLADIQSTLASHHDGEVPYLGCSGKRYNETDAGKGSLDNGFTALTEVWYYYHVYGPVQAGKGKPVGADINGGSISSCAKADGAVWYYERAKGSERKA